MEIYNHVTKKSKYNHIREKRKLHKRPLVQELYSENNKEMSGQKVKKILYKAPRVLITTMHSEKKETHKISVRKSLSLEC